MKILVVGLNPSRKHGNSPTIKSLYKWLDELGVKYVSFVNLYDGYDIMGSNSTIDDICALYPQYDKVLAIGSDVSKELSKRDVPHFKLPHPSGLNRQMNDKKFVHDQLTLCKNYLWGEA